MANHTPKVVVGKDARETSNKRESSSSSSTRKVVVVTKTKDLEVDSTKKSSSSEEPTPTLRMSSSIGSSSTSLTAPSLLQSSSPQSSFVRIQPVVPTPCEDEQDQHQEVPPPPSLAPPAVRDDVSRDSSDDDHQSQEQEDDERWCEGSRDRIGEYGVIGAEQSDESYYDDRSNGTEFTDGKLNFIENSRKLYGRDVELNQLEQIYDTLTRSTTNGTTGATTTTTTKTEYYISLNDQESKVFDDSEHGALSDDDDFDCHDAKIVLLSGLSGTGKSALVEQFIKNLDYRIVLESAQQNEEDERNAAEGTSTERSSGTPTCRPLFLSGKYDENQSSDPFYGIATAIGSVCRELDKLGLTRQELDRIKSTIKSAVAEQGNALTKIIPELTVIIGDDVTKGHTKNTSRNDAKSSTPTTRAGTSSTTIKAEFAVNRLKYVFQNFIKALCAQGRPVILFLDDLQWIDDASLGLIRSLLLDDTMKHLMFIGAYRSNEVDEDHRLQLSLFDPLNAKKKKKSDVQHIELTELGSDSISRFIADSLKLELDEAGALAEAIYNKTRGNIFHVKQSLEELYRKNALYYDVMIFKWSWNLTKVDLEDAISDDVLGAVRSKIEHMPNRLQSALTLAAFMRSTFDIDTLQALLQSQAYAGSSPTTKMALQKMLEKAVLKGLLINSVGTNEYSFAHDRIQEAAISFVPQEDRKEFRFKIAKFLLARSRQPKVGEDWMLFVAVDAFNAVGDSSSSNNIYDSTFMDPLSLAKLNYEVAERSIAVSAMKAASDYLCKSIQELTKVTAASSLLWGDDQHYSFTLQVHQAAAEVELALGNFTKGYHFSQVVLSNARTLDDKIPTFLAYGTGLSNNERHHDALAVKLEALNQLVGFPVSFHMLHVVKLLPKVKSMLKKYSDEDLLNLPKITDRRKVAAVELLYTMGHNAFFEHKVMTFVLCVLFSMDMLVRYGICVELAPAIASYGILAGGEFGDQKTADRVGRLALKMVGSAMNSKHVETRVLFLNYAFVRPWGTSMQETLENVEQGYTVGMQCGDRQTSTYNLVNFTTNHWIAGYKLDDVAKLARGLVWKSEDEKDETMVMYNSPLLSLIEHMMGLNDTDPDWKNLDKLPAEGLTGEIICQAYLYRLQLAYYFGHFEVATKLARLLYNVSKTDSTAIRVLQRLFYTCLSACGVARETGRRRYYRQAFRARNELKAIMKARGDVFLHRLMLLDAECKSLKSRNMWKVIGAYDAAITAASDAGYTNDEALANELAGDYLRRIGRDNLSQTYLVKARDLYAEWGATSKVDHLVRKCSSIIGTFASYPKSLSGCKRVSSMVGVALEEKFEKTRTSVRFSDVAFRVPKFDSGEFESLEF